MGMTTKRTLLALGLGMALTGGAATAVHASNHTVGRPAAGRTTTHPATEQADGTVEQGAGAADPAGGANVQSGAQDTTGVDTAETPSASEGEAAASAADPAGGANVQSGGQSGGQSTQ